MVHGIRNLNSLTPWRLGEDVLCTFPSIRFGDCWQGRNEVAKLGGSQGTMVKGVWVVPTTANSSGPHFAYCGN
jgi:hypothetical protein